MWLLPFLMFAVAAAIFVYRSLSFHGDSNRIERQTFDEGFALGSRDKIKIGRKRELIASEDGQPVEMEVLRLTGRYRKQNFSAEYFARVGESKDDLIFYRIEYSRLQVDLRGSCNPPSATMRHGTETTDRFEQVVSTALLNDAMRARFQSGDTIVLADSAIEYRSDTAWGLAPFRAVLADVADLALRLEAAFGEGEGLESLLWENFRNADNELVRAGSLEALVQANHMAPDTSEKLSNALQQALHSESAHTRLVAAQELGDVNSLRSLAYETLLPPSKRQSAFQSLLLAVDPAVKNEELDNALHSVLEELSAAAIRHIGATGNQLDIARIAAVPRTRERMSATVDALAQIASEQGIALLKELAEQRDELDIARRAILALADVGDASVVSWLKDLSSDQVSTKEAVQKLQSRLTESLGSVSLADGQDNAGSLSTTPQAWGALSEPQKD